MAYSTFTLTGRHETPSGKAHQGQVVVTANTVIRDVAGKVVMAGRESVSLDADGAWSLVLPCDSAGLNPASGIGYTIGFALRSSALAPVSFYATADMAGSTLDVSQIVSVPVPTPLSAIVGPQGEAGPAGADGAPGPKGDPGDTVFKFDTDGTPYSGTTATPDTRVVTESTIKRIPGAGAFTSGDVLKLGTNAYVTRTDVGTSLVQGGAPNYENVIGGNVANVDTGTSNLTGAPTLTGSNGNWNFLLGGYDTVVNGWANSVVGFHSKVDVDANHCTLGGGSRNSAAASTAYGTIGGGTQNQISGTNPTVGGGNTNKAIANGATVTGGQTNTASGTGATVAGGVSNTASGANSTILGGSSNTTSGNSALAAGLTNTASGTAALALGRDNLAAFNYSVATGRGAVTAEEGQHAHANAPFAVNGDAQISRWALKKQTTDGTAVALDAGISTPPVIPADTTWAFSALVVARRADVDGENAAWEIKGCFKRDAGNTAALVGTPTITSLGASAAAAAWTVTVGSFPVGTFRLLVTGEAAKTIRWVAELRAASVSG